MTPDITRGWRRARAHAGTMATVVLVGSTAAATSTPVAATSSPAPSPAPGSATCVPALGAVGSWGSDGFGELGNGITGSAFNRSIPGSVLRAPEGGPLTGIAAIAMGPGHGLALSVAGPVLAWGSDARGELGGGAAGPPSPVPVTVVGVGGAGSLGGVAAVAVGGAHSLALRRDHSVVAWGGGFRGQLGNGSTGDSPIPVPVPGLADAVAVAAGGTHSLALRAGGTVVAWGDNSRGQLGTGTGLNSSLPVAVPGLAGVVAVAAGQAHSLAVRSDGSVVAWGAGDSGQLGDGLTADSPTPVAVRGVGGVGTLGGVTAVAAGQSHSLALRSDGSVAAWGFNGGSSGWLGTGSGDTVDPLPAIVTGGGGTGQITGATAIAAGAVHSAALEADGSVLSWGDNSAGELADGTTAGHTAPVAAVAPAGSGRLTAVTALAAGGEATLVLSTGSLGAAAAVDGTPQNATVLSGFATPLRMAVTGADGHGVPNVAVTFFAPITGPGGTFANPGTLVGADTSAAAVTDSNGMASAPAFTANQNAGTYSVVASSTAPAFAILFTLTNAPLDPTGPLLVSSAAGTPQSVTSGQVASTPLRAIVTAAGTGASTGAAQLPGPVSAPNLTATGQAVPVPGQMVTFTVLAGANGAGGSFAGGPMATATTDRNGIATAPALIANATAGGYSVSATTTGGGTTGGYLLTNVPGPASSCSNTPPTLSGDASALYLQGVTVAGRHLPDGGQGVCEAGPVTTQESSSTTTGAAGCEISNGFAGAGAVSGATEAVTTQGDGASAAASAAHSNAASLSLLPGALPGGLDVLDASTLDAVASATCGHQPSGSSSIGALTIAGQRLATQPVSSRIIFNPTGKNPITLYGNPITVDPTGARVPMAVVTLNYSRHDPAANTQVISPLEVEFPAGGALASVIVGRVFVSYARAACT